MFLQKRNLFKIDKKIYDPKEIRFNDEHIEFSRLIYF